MPNEDKIKEEKLKENVRTRYGNLAKTNSSGMDCGAVSSCCGASAAMDVNYSKRLGYSETEALNVPQGANMGLGCGNPQAIANLKAGETVLDLGSGGGFDCFLAAKQVGSTGRVIGVDMTSDMIMKARSNALKGGYQNVEFRLGEIEALPLADNCVDVILSNCVINLTPNKPRVFQEAARVLKSGGRLAIADIVATDEIPTAIKEDFELHSGCMAGATPIEDLKKALKDAGFVDINITIKEESRAFIKDWAPNSGAENYVASATIEAKKA